MMGGQMIFCGDLAIALIVEERLYLKVDGATSDRFAQAGGEPFVYERDGKSVQMSFWTPPDAALEDPHEMRPWGLLALEAAGRSKEKKKRPPRTAKARQASRRAKR